MGTPKIKSATKFRTDLFDTLREVAEGKTHLITHNQGQPVVLISQEQYDAILDEKEVLREIAIGTAQIDAGKGIPHKKMLQEFRKMKAGWR